MSSAVSSRIKPSVLFSPSPAGTWGRLRWTPSAGGRGERAALTAGEGAGDTVLGAEKTFGSNFSDIQ